jgi:hypothetical protein
MSIDAGADFGRSSVVCGCADRAKTTANQTKKTAATVPANWTIQGLDFGLLGVSRGGVRKPEA